MSDNEEYEVESVTRARVHDKKDKKLTWRYYVKWKGYSWEENTWEPVEHFSEGSQKVLEEFWRRADTGGRNIDDATAFKQGEEIVVTGPPGKAGLKRSRSAVRIKQLATPDQRSVTSQDAVIGGGPPSARKRRKVRKSHDEALDVASRNPQTRSPRVIRRVSMGLLKGVKESQKRVKRRRASSPGPRVVSSRRLPSGTNSDLDAEGEVDPDAEEVTKEIEDALIHLSSDDEDDGPSPKGTAISGKAPKFGDLQHFYNSHPIEIERVPSVEAQPEGSGPPVPGSPDPLFDSPPRPKDDSRQRSRESSIPFHRARAAKPRVILLDPSVSETSTAITTKARLMSLSASNNPGGVAVRATAKRGGKSGPGRPSASRNRSSLLTASRGKLTTVKGNFAPTDAVPNQLGEVEGVPNLSSSASTQQLIATRADEDAAMKMDDTDRMLTMLTTEEPPPVELPLLGEIEMDASGLPDYEDESPVQETLIENPQDQEMAELREDEHTSAVVIDEAAIQATQVSLDPAATEPPTSSSLTIIEVQATNATADVVPTAAEDIMKKNVALAKEQLFPSVQPSSTFSEAPTSFRSTIFGPLYQGASPTHASNGVNDESSTFNIIINDTVSIPLTLKGGPDTKGPTGDIKPGSFYGPSDALAIVNTLRSLGLAQAVPAPTASEEEKEHLAAFVQRLGSSRMCVISVGRDVFVLCSSKNVAVAEKLSTPAHLVGSPDTLLISRAVIENQLTYGAAVYRAKPEWA